MFERVHYPNEFKSTLDDGRPYAGWTWSFSTCNALQIAMEAIGFNYEHWVNGCGGSFLDIIIGYADAHCQSGKVGVFILRSKDEKPGEELNLLSPILVIDPQRRLFDVFLFFELLPEWQDVLAAREYPEKA